MARDLSFHPAEEISHLLVALPKGMLGIGRGQRTDLTCQDTDQLALRRSRADA